MNRRSGLPRLFAAIGLVTANACVTTPRFLQPAPEREWRPTLDRVRQLASDGQTVKADSLLSQYAATYPGSPQAIETTYWRSLLQLQSPMGAQGTGFAIPMLRAYLAAGPTTEHRLEADVLLRAAARVDTLSRATASLTSRVETSDGEVITANARVADAKADAKAEAKVATADTKDQEAEIRRLKEDLAKSKDELERIKKRLAEPPKKPPVRQPTAR